MNDLRGEAWLRSKDKRLQDLQVVLPAIPLALMGALVSIGALKLENRSLPTWFKQERSGRAGHAFNIFKLRTLNAVDSEGLVSLGIDDIRATKMGRLMRIMGFDEIPQVLNIVKGEMSVVGPRPIVADDFWHMRDTLSPTEYEEWMRAYTSCRPGLVSNYAVKTHRSDPLIERTYYARAACDVEYYEQASRSTDSKIMKEALFLGPLLVREAAHLAFTEVQ